MSPRCPCARPLSGGDASRLVELRPPSVGTTKGRPQGVRHPAVSRRGVRGRAASLTLAAATHLPRPAGRGRDGVGGTAYAVGSVFSLGWFLTMRGSSSAL